MTEPAQPAKPVVAVFDFDGTITWADSFIPFLRHVEQHFRTRDYKRTWADSCIPFLRESSGFAKFWLGLLVLSPVTLAHVLGLVSNSRAKECVMRFFLAGRTAEQLELAAKSFASSDRLTNLLNPVAMERLAWHQREGHRLLLLSASPELYLRHWAAANGFATTIGTRLEMSEGRATGRMSGLNCHGAEKVRRLEAELGALDQFEIHGYGDSRADLLLLDRIQHPHFRSFEGGSRLAYRFRAVSKFLCGLA